MILHLCAKMAATAALAVTLGMASPPATSPATLPDPVKVRFQLADGVRVSGELTAFDREGFDGTFGRREWNAIMPDDVYAIHLRVMNQSVATDWINLGRVLLLMTHDEKKAGELAEKAFGRALHLDPSVRQAVDDAREDARLARQKRIDAAKAADAAKLSTISPEGEPWPADAWPALSLEDQKCALLEMRAQAQQILDQAGLSFTPVETDHILFYSDMQRSESSRCAFLLERGYDLTRSLLARGRSDPAQAVANIFRGKLVVFVFKDQDRFKLVEADSFRHLVPQITVAVCHPDGGGAESGGGRVFINAHRTADEELFQWSILHELVHAVLHRHHSPKRLPAWANEGFAEAVCGRLLRDSSIGRERRRNGLKFLRNPDANLAALLDLTYADAGFPGPNEVGVAVGGLVVELVMQEQPQRFIDWLNAIKKGKDWDQALSDHFGTTKAKLAETATAYYRVND